MITRMAAVGRCGEVCGLAPHEMIVGVSPSKKHALMFERYRRMGGERARLRLVAEIRAALAVEAVARAADLLVVLRALLAPGATVTPGRPAPRRRAHRGRARMQWAQIGAHQPAAQEREGAVTYLFDASRPARH